MIASRSVARQHVFVGLPDDVGAGLAVGVVDPGVAKIPVLREHECLDAAQRGFKARGRRAEFLGALRDTLFQVAPDRLELPQRRLVRGHLASQAVVGFGKTRRVKCWLFWSRRGHRLYPLSQFANQRDRAKFLLAACNVNA